MLHHADELFSKQDLAAGKKLVAEALGYIGVMGGAFTLFTSVLPGVGVVLAPAQIAMMMKRISDEYVSMSEAERKQVRAVVKWVKGGFDLTEYLLED